MIPINSKTNKASKKEAYALAEKLHAGDTLATSQIESLLLYFAPPTPKKAKTAMQWLAKAVAVQDVRQYLCYIWVDANGMGRGTDGHALHHAQLEGVAEGYYCPKTLLPVTGIGMKYPDTDRIFNSANLQETHYEIQSGDLATYLSYGKDKIAAYGHEGSYVNKLLLDNALNSSEGQIKMNAVHSGNHAISHQWRGTSEFGEYIVMGLRP